MKHMHTSWRWSWTVWFKCFLLYWGFSRIIRRWFYVHFDRQSQGTEKNRSEFKLGTGNTMGHHQGWQIFKGKGGKFLGNENETKIIDFDVLHLLLFFNTVTNLKYVSGDVNKKLRNFLNHRKTWKLFQNKILYLDQKRFQHFFHQIFEKLGPQI